MGSKHKKGSKILLITIIIVIITAIIIAAYNQKYLKAYYYNFSNNHYHEGDKIYASEKFIKNTDKLSITLIRITQNQHFPYDYDLVFTPYDFSNDSLRKYNANLIGTYLDYKLIPISYKEKSGIIRLYAIKPNLKLVDDPLTTPYSSSKGYYFIDSNYYILGTTSFIKAY